METRIKLQQIKASFLAGEITYEQAKEIAKPYIYTINKKAEEIAKQYGGKAKKLTFSYIMR